MNTKKNIKTFGKLFDYLLDPQLREKGMGDALLTCEGAEIGGTIFRGLIWRNIRFVDCDFVGAYEIKLAEMSNCVFERCRFSGIFAWGVQNAVRFVGCTVAGASHLWGEEGSRGVTYEKCNLTGTSSDSNRWGSVGTYGEATFLKCNGRWMGVLGHSSLVIQDCTFDSMECKIDSKESKGIVPHALIQGSRLRGRFDMVSSSFQSLTLRDIVLDELDLTRARVKGDIVMERVRGGYINAYVGEAKSLSMRNCQISGDGHKVFEAYAGGIKTIEIDGVTFGGGLSTEPVTIAGGFSLKSVERISNVSESIVIRNSTIPRLDASYLNTRSVVLQNNTVDSLDLSNGRVGNLLIGGNNFARTVDFTGTHAQESKVQPLAKGQVKLDGSNVEVG
ncbi:hypothetical protein [Variovorax arabinosiphilus]|uniref:hypothetical protein n=1 Tax=Variovorax arabinosiphilus TaxID=3053498 RepID=UPI002576F835|nr:MULTISPECIES: hypothetical protein [unclassified Variovorax]MDM0120863.1 hypothetical protein [Variovorax sp. J2L1-78]MDM0127225.1 hypothetical protein [Variovorax sp. J2L1-63]MDM0236243.1 hypothetical protein [Variovorax sp. J2R1-6]